MNTGVGYHALLQGIFLTQGSNPWLLCLLHWQAGSLSLTLPKKNQGRCFLVLEIEETGSVSKHSSGFPFPPLCVFLYPHYQHKGLSEIIWLTNGPIINNIDPSYITHLLHINDTEWVPLRALLLFRRKDFDESIAYRQKFKKIQNHIFEIKPSVVWTGMIVSSFMHFQHCHN